MLDLIVLQLESGIWPPMQIFHSDDSAGTPEGGAGCRGAAGSR